jgi:DNA-binding beta-propeller fold protein YncE
VSGLSAVRRPVSSLPIVAKIDIPGFPDWVGIDDPQVAVWISNRDRNNIARVDPTTNRVAVEVAVGRGPCSGLAVGHGSVWVPCCPDRTVIRIDGPTNRVLARIAVPVGSSEGASPPTITRSGCPVTVVRAS